METLFDQAPQDHAQALRVLIVDDNAEVRQALHLLLLREREYRVVGDTGTTEGMLQLAEATRPSIVFLDLDLERLDAGVLRELRIRSPGVRIIGLMSRPELVHELISHIDALVQETEGPRALLDALERVHDDSQT